MELLITSFIFCRSRTFRLVSS